MDLDALMTRFRGPLVGFLAGLGNDRQRAVELAQDTFAEAYLSRERFRESWDKAPAVGSWLRGIAHNLHMARWRRDRGPRAMPSTDAADHDAADHDAADHDAADHVAADHDAADHDAASDTGPAEPSPVAVAVERLRGPWRTVLQMRYVDGSGLPEIAAVLGLSVRAVEGRLRRAREELKKLLVADGHQLAKEESR